MADPLVNSGTATVTGGASGMSKVVAGANVGFRVGSQLTVDNMIREGTGATHGTFYLTEDSHRLYVGNSDGTLSAVNEGITTVASINDLPSLTQSGIGAAPYLGRFYYVKGTNLNILCVATYDSADGTAKWVQLNPDTYLDTNVNRSKVTVTDGSATGTDNVTHSGATITNIIADTGGRSISESWTLRALKNIDLQYYSDTNLVTLSVPDSGIYGQYCESYSDPESGNVVGVKITLKEYTSSSQKANDVTYASSHSGAPSNSYGSVVKEIILRRGDDNNIVPTLQSDGSIKLVGGGLTGSSDITLTQSTSDTDSIVLTVKDGNNNSIRANIKQTVTLGTNNPIPFTLTQTATKGVNNAQENAYTLNATLPVYTKTEVDNMLSQNASTADAMYFAGTIGTGGTVSSLEALIKATGATYTNLAVKNGATFKITEAQNNNITGVTAATEGFSPTTIGNNPMEVGDVIIVTGVEGSNGLITNLNAATTKYIYIPSGNDDDIYFTPNLGASTDKEVKFVQHTTGPNAQTYGIEFAPGSQISISAVNAGPPDISYNKKTFTIGHGTISTTAGTNTAITESQNALNDSTSYNAIVEMTTNNGHVTAYKTQQITLYHNRLRNVTSTIAADTSVSGQSAILLSKVYNQGTGPLSVGNDNNQVRFSSNTLNITAAAAGTATGTANTAADIRIDMVWGSF